MTKKLAAKIKLLPQKPGVYLFKDQTGRILYIGKAIKLRHRVRSHFNMLPSFLKEDEGGFKSPLIPLYKGGNKFVKQIADLDFITTTNEKEALILENDLIKKYQPRYNVQWRDDKSYLWVSFSNDEWPRVQIAHRTDIIPSNNNAPSSRSRGTPPPLKLRGGWGELFQPIGPFVNGRELKQILRALRKILPYRTCKNPYGRPCLQWHLGLCPAHTSTCHSRESGNPGSGSRVHRSSGAGKPGMTKEQYYRSLNTLRQFLRFYAGESLRLEAYDISNIQGTNATGSMIVFAGAKPKKSAYRRFRIKTVSGANDVKMLKEVLRRRLNHKEWPLPDLMLIDGGRPQLNAANLSLITYHLSLPIVALAKKNEELYTIYSNRTLRLNALPTSLRLLFQAIRNEAHRFAIYYYRKLHRKRIKG